MLKRHLPLLSLLLLFLLIFSLLSCSASPVKEGEAVGEDHSYLTFTDDAGVEISLTEKPETTAVLFSSFADIYKTVGGEVGITVGEAIERGFAPEGTPLVDDGAGKSINEELLISYAPDLVLCSMDIPAQAETAEKLNALGIPCAQFRVESFADYLRVLTVFADITGNPDAVETYGTAVRDQIDALLSSVPTDAAPKKILFIRAGSTAAATKAKTAEQHFAAAMLSELHTSNIADNAPLLVDGLSVEEILMENPDAIFITTMGNADAAVSYMEELFSEPVWQGLDAVREGNYYFLPKDLFQYKPNARWYEAYKTLYDLLYENTEA